MVNERMFPLEFNVTYNITTLEQKMRITEAKNVGQESHYRVAEKSV